MGCPGGDVVPIALKDVVPNMLQPLFDGFLSVECPLTRGVVRGPVDPSNGEERSKYAAWHGDLKS